MKFDPYKDKVTPEVLPAGTRLVTPWNEGDRFIIWRNNGRDYEVRDSRGTLHEEGMRGRYFQTKYEVASQASLDTRTDHFHRRKRTLLL